MKTEQEIIEKIVEIELKLKTLELLGESEGVGAILIIIKTKLETLRWVIQS